MLSAYEKETIINYNQAEKIAHCYTYDKALIRRLDKLCEISSEIIVKKTGDGYKEYTFPRKWIKVKFPRQLSSEKRKELQDRARANFGHASESRD